MRAFARVPTCLLSMARLQKIAFPIAGVAINCRANRSARLNRSPVGNRTKRADERSPAASPGAKIVTSTPRDSNPVRMPDTRASVPRLRLDRCDSRIPTLVSSGPHAMRRRVSLFLSENHEHTRDRRETREGPLDEVHGEDRKSTRLNSSHVAISYAVFCLKKKNMYG